MNLKSRITNLFETQNSRSLIIKKNIIELFIIRGLSVVISLIIVPMTINYISPNQYGIWLTLSSMVAWVSFFDIGFTQGLRNRYSEAIANNDINLARIYVSTAYFFVGILFIIVWSVLITVNLFIDWRVLLNIQENEVKEVVNLTFIIISYFCLQFIFSIINTILIADQKTSRASLINLIGQLLGLLIIFILTKFTKGSIIYLGLALGVAPTLVIIFFNIYLFNTKYKLISPSVKFVKRKFAKQIINLGIKFFIIQLAGIVQYQTANFLIAHYFGTSEVTSYNIAFKYFGILNIGFSSIILAPFWSSVTEAYVKGDIQWIINAVKKFRIIWVIFTIIGFLMLIFSNWFYRKWLGGALDNIDFSISFWSLIFYVTAMFAGIHISVLNGINALRIQFYLCFITPIIFIFCSIMFIKYLHLGISSILISNVIANFSGFIIDPIQYYKVILMKKNNIWAK